MHHNSSHGANGKIFLNFLLTLKAKDYNIILGFIIVFFFLFYSL